MRRRLSIRGWLTLITLVLLSVVVIFAWPEIRKAWELLGTVNLWILALLIPVQLFSYYATGGMIFSYLRSKGNLKDVSQLRMARISLELNFVNHILPSGGAAGFSYLGWVLSHHGVSPGRSTMAQIIRFALTFVSFVLLLVVAVLLLVLDHQLNRFVILICVGLAFLCVAATFAAIAVIGNKRRMDAFAAWLTRTVNRFVRWISRGKRQNVLKPALLDTFFGELHEDFIAIRRERRILIKPFIWATFANMADVALIGIAFWALGFPISPALLFVAFGVASLASAVSVTPGGAGVYETLMVTFLASSNIPAGIAIAGTLLARVTLVVGTVLFGYVFYQMTVIKYGKRSAQR
jgi:uncharacterized protein (TIRG00374 family)